jgi:hypothetical protein
MNILIINGSPKKKGGAAAFFSKVIKFMLFPKKVTYKTLGLSKNYENILAEFKNIDAVVFSVPLYVDSIPSHMISFLKQLEQFCINNKCKFLLYVISNSGFIGGKQNQAHLEQYKCWCEHSGITWGGGLGIGGGVMLHVIFYLIFLLSIIRFVIGIIFNIVFEKPIIDAPLLYGFARSMTIWLFFSSGMLFCKLIFAWAIKMKKSIKNMYTRVMIPSFVFLIFASVFMFFDALFKGKIFSLNKKGDYSRYIK